MLTPPPLMEGRIRRASPTDAPVLSALEPTAFDGTPTTPDHRTWVIELDGDLCGFCRTGPSRDPSADVTTTTEIQSFRMHADHEGRGLGRSLVTWAIDDLRERGYVDVTVRVTESDARARRFFEQASFRLDGPADKSEGFAKLPYRLRL